MSLSKAEITRHRDSGVRFESELKRLLIMSGLDAWNLGYNERADILVVNHKDRVIECKVVHGTAYNFSRNSAKQHKRLIKYQEEHPDSSVYYAVKYVYRRSKSEIKFYALSEIIFMPEISMDSPFGYSLNQFVSHCKEEE